ncbi:tetratricopeptide repeat protein [Pseudomonas sp.]|uniref:tetratricopeptide repeat protein n=1 Tax=Pseudomonas sp. TaxID=306 RepID=UPI0039C9AA73
MFLLLSAGLTVWFRTDSLRPIHPISGDHWVSEDSCQTCHQPQHQSWQGSHHHLAMQSANEHSVLGDFNDHTFVGQRARTHFQRKADGFWVSTTGADGQPADYPVAFTFGVEPLQQYLLALPDGRLQAFDVAWDTQKEQWFELYPDQQIEHDNALHWAGPNQNANFMCLECHTTGFKRNYDPLTDRYASTWQALGVGCQSCHGPAAGHLEWLKRPTEKAGYGFSSAAVDDSAGREAEVCGRCHSRRAALSDGYQHANRMMDDYLPSILSPVLNEIDGKIKDEVFEYGSFVQSRMYAAGVRCTDCHNPHSAELRTTGNALCTQCHNPSGQAARPGIDSSGLISKNYDSPEHHRHQQETVAAQCISCHMPARHFMVKDQRHDHSFSVPNPAQALKLGHGDACLGCHTEMPLARLQTQFKQLFSNPQSRDNGYASTLFAARHGGEGALAAVLEQLQREDLPAIRRATLLAELYRYPSQRTLRSILQALAHSEPQVREVAVSSLAALAPERLQMQALSPVLQDPVRAVRIAAAWQIAQLPQTGRAAPAGFEQAIREYEQGQRSLRERPEANVNLAMLYQLDGRTKDVEPALREALKRDRRYQPARILLAQWLESQGDAQAGIKLLEEGLNQSLDNPGETAEARENYAEKQRSSAINTHLEPTANNTSATPSVFQQPDERHAKDAALHHALAMASVRQGQRGKALNHLEKAHNQAPDNSDYLYAYAIGLHESGEKAEAEKLLDIGLKRDPTNRAIRQALLAYAAQAGDKDKTALLLRTLQAINPEDPLLAQ